MRQNYRKAGQSFYTYDQPRLCPQKTRQMKGESIALYHVRLRLQVAKCSFANPDDAKRSKFCEP